MKCELSIGQVAQQSGVASTTIRYYEQIGLLAQTERLNGRRCYSNAILERLHAIQTAQQLGFSLSQIRTLLQNENQPLPQRWQELAYQKIDELEALIQQAQHMQERLRKGLQCSCEDLSECFDCLAGSC